MIDMGLDDLNFAIQVKQNELDRTSRLIDTVISRGGDPSALDEKYQRLMYDMEALCEQRRKEV